MCTSVNYDMQAHLFFQSSCCGARRDNHALKLRCGEEISTQRNPPPPGISDNRGRHMLSSRSDAHAHVQSGRLATAKNTCELGIRLATAILMTVHIIPLDAAIQ